MNKVLKFYDYDRALVFYEEAFLHIHQAPVKRSGFKIVAKPILLLTILKAIDDGFITINRFSYDQMESRYTALFKTTSCKLVKKRSLQCIILGTL